MYTPTRRALSLGVILSLPALVTTGAELFYVLGNGWGLGALALGTVPVLLLSPAVLAAPGRHRPAAAVLTVCLLVLDTAFATARLQALDPAGPIAYCEDGVCGVSPPLLASIIREDESALAGIALATFAGAVLKSESDEITASTPSKYRALDRLRSGRPGVNALLLSSSPQRVRGVISMPKLSASSPVPAIVFLHGYGGSLTAYISTLREEDALAGYAIVAPALDWSGRWWDEDGLAVITRTLDTLPPGIDRERLALVGLSNGAIGVVAAIAHPVLGPRFRVAVALEGLADAEAFGAPKVPLLGIAARDDVRFSLKGMKRAAHSLEQAAARGEGAAFTLQEVEGNHMAFFTNSQALNAALAKHLGEYLPSGQPDP